MPFLTPKNVCRVLAGRGVRGSRTTVILRVPTAADADVERRADPMLPPLLLPPRHASPSTGKHQVAPAADAVAAAAELSGDEQPTLITPNLEDAAIPR